MPELYGNVGSANDSVGSPITQHIDRLKHAVGRLHDLRTEAAHLANVLVGTRPQPPSDQRGETVQSVPSGFMDHAAMLTTDIHTVIDMTFEELRRIRSIVGNT